MDWNGNNLRIPFVSRPTETYNMSFLYNCSFDQFPVLEMRQPTMQEALMLPGLMENNGMNHMGHDSKKKRLSNEQLEMLENSFQDEIKLEPERKMKLAKELGLQPRQIAVWFQNRRARWKGKQLERLYDALKEEYDAVSRDKQKLQQEVLALRAILKDQVAKKQVSTDFSGEETVESTSIPSSDNHHRHHHHQPSVAATANMHQTGACNYSLNVDDYNNNNAVMMHPYWPNSMPSSP